MRIDLHGRQFSTLVPDADGTEWMMTEWEGWDSPSQRQSLISPTSQHGGVLTESLLGTRALTLTGVVKARTEALFWKAWNDMLALSSNLVTTRSLVVYEGLNPKKMGVIRAAEVRLAFAGVNASPSRCRCWPWTR